MATLVPSLPAQAGPLSGALQANPLAVGTVFFALGALIGLLVPETRSEHELFGPKKDQLAQQAQDAAQGMAQKVGTVTAAAQSAAHDALEKSKTAVQEAVTEAVTTVKDEAKNQGLPLSS